MSREYIKMRELSVRPRVIRSYSTFGGFFLCFFYWAQVQFALEQGGFLFG